MEPTLEMVDSQYEIIGAIRRRYPLLPDSEIREVLDQLDKVDALYQDMLNAQVARDYE